MKKSKFLLVLIILTIALFIFMEIIPQNVDSKAEDHKTSIKTSNDDSPHGYLMNTSAQYNWVEISSTGILSSISNASYGFDEIYFNRGWNFTFYGTEYDKLYLSPNGWMKFTNHEMSSSPPYHIPSAQINYIDSIMLFASSYIILDELNGGNGTVYYEFMTSPNRLVIQYKDVYLRNHSSGGMSTQEGIPLGTFEVILYELGKIVFQYQHLNKMDFFFSVNIGLDHADGYNYNLYQDYSYFKQVNEKAIEFEFDKLYKFQYALNKTIGLEKKYIISYLDNSAMENRFGENWEIQFGLPLDPIKAFKTKIRILSSTENSTDMALSYNIWNYTNRFNNFGENEAQTNYLAYKKNPFDYEYSHILPFYFPFIIPRPVVQYLVRESLDQKYQTHSLSLYGTNRNGSITFSYDYDMYAKYNSQGILLDLYVRDQNRMIFRLEELKNFFLEPTDIEIKENQEHVYMLNCLNETKISHLLGENWEQIVGFPLNSKRYQKMKFNITKITNNDTHWKIDYDVFSWTNRKNEFDNLAIENDSFQYLIEPFDYIEPHLFKNIVPFVIPKPTSLYLFYSNLDSQVYSRFYSSDFYYEISINLYNLIGKNVFIRACYDNTGILRDMYWQYHDPNNYNLVNLCHIMHFDDEGKPSNVLVEENQTFEYGVFINENFYPISYPDLDYTAWNKLNICITQITDYDKFIGRSSIFSNISILLNNDQTFDFNPTLPQSSLLPLSEIDFIYNDSRELSGIFMGTGIPSFIPIDINWLDFKKATISLFENVIPNNFEFEIETFKNGFHFSYGYGNQKQGYIVNYTKSGIIDTFSMIFYDFEIFSIRLNDFDYQFAHEDTRNPNITINKPESDSYYSSKAPEIKINIQDDHHDTTWYNLKDDLLITDNLSYTEKIDPITWQSLKDGEIILTVYTNDTAGNIGSSHVNFYKDTEVPIISITEPEQNTYYSSIVPNIDIIVSDDNHESTWCYLKDDTISSNNFSYTGELDQTLWESLEDGMITLMVYANDSAGNIGSSAVSFYKDTIKPIIFIHSPSNDDKFQDPPKYSISLQELNYDKVWYTLDNGSYSYEITEYSGKINKTAWESLPNGDIFIHFYIADKAGNMDSELIKVFKYKENTINIPGFNIIEILAFLGAGILLYFPKFEKKI